MVQDLQKQLQERTKSLTVIQSILSRKRAEPADNKPAQNWKSLKAQLETIDKEEDKKEENETTEEDKKENNKEETKEEAKEENKKENKEAPEPRKIKPDISAGKRKWLQAVRGSLEEIRRKKGTTTTKLTTAQDFVEVSKFD